MDEDRANLRRWIISAAIVVGLHGSLAAVLLRWHKTISAEPFVMDLAPWAGASTPELGGVQPSLAGLERPSAAAPAQPASQPAAEKAAEAGSAGPGSAEAPQAPQARMASGGVPANAHGSATANNPAPNGPAPNIPPPSDHRANNPVPINPAPTIPVPNIPAANNPAVNSPPPSNPLNSTPIDTRITVQGPLRGRGLGTNEAKGQQLGIGQKGQIIFRPSNRPGDLAHPRGFTLPGVSVPGIAGTRPPGARVQDRARAAMGRQINAIGNVATGLGARGGPHAGDHVATNAIGIAGPGVGGRGSGANGAGTITINAIGLAVQVPRGAAAAKGIDGHSANVNAPAMNFGQRGVGSVALVGGTSALNGRAMMRPGAATGGIGGPGGRAAGGVLNGSDFHPKIP